MSRSSIQSCILNIYKEFYAICKKHNIKFCGVAGTAIGAVRHNGFIPWDDDLDVGMPIGDFEKFCKICKKELPEHLGFIESMWMGGKIYDKRTTIIDIRDLPNLDRYHGVYVDIFPMIGLPDDLIEREKFIVDIKNYATNAELFEHYPKVSSFSKKELLDWRNYLLKAHDYNTANKLAGFTYFMCDGDGFRNPAEMKFEDTVMPISSAYDWDLSEQFGDYMTPPPKDQQKTHDKYHIADLKNSFTKYQEDYKKLPDWALEIIQKKQQVEGELTQYASSLNYNLSELNKKHDELINELTHSTDFRLGHALLKPARLIRRKKK
jgi:lipopolysaccharide cholinephosphotransferase